MSPLNRRTLHARGGVRDERPTLGRSAFGQYPRYMGERQPPHSTDRNQTNRGLPFRVIARHGLRQRDMSKALRVDLLIGDDRQDIDRGLQDVSGSIMVVPVGQRFGDQRQAFRSGTRLHDRSAGTQRGVQQPRTGLRASDPRGDGRSNGLIRRCLRDGQRLVEQPGLDHLLREIHPTFVAIRCVGDFGKCGHGVLEFRIVGARASEDHRHQRQGPPPYALGLRGGPGLPVASVSGKSDRDMFHDLRRLSARQVGERCQRRVEITSIGPSDGDRRDGFGPCALVRDGRRGALGRLEKSSMRLRGGQFRDGRRPVRDFLRGGEGGLRGRRVRIGEFLRYRDQDLASRAGARRPRVGGPCGSSRRWR